MNIKMSINSQLSIIESKKQTKQTRRTETDHGYEEHFDGCQIGWGYGEMGELLR